MKNTSKILLPLSAIFGLTSIGHAQNNTQELSPLSVVESKSDIPSLSSGMKTSMPTKDIPQSLSIMTNDQFKTQGLKGIGDIIDYTPGVNTSQGEGHRDAAVIRGVRTTQDFYETAFEMMFNTTDHSIISTRLKFCVDLTLLFPDSAEPMV